MKPIRTKPKRERAMQTAHVSFTCCSFKRTKTAELENGVMINHDKLIIDAAGEIVPAPIHSYSLQEYCGHIVLLV